MACSCCYIALFSIQSVRAAIYGTNPIASTVLSAGRITTIQWVDDHTKPSLSEMGPVKIDLYVGDSKVTTLADQVDPTSRSIDVWISPSLRHNGSDYHMRFICQQPPLTVYTADFTITDMASISPLDGLTIDAHNESAPIVTYITPRLTLVLPDTTIVSTLKPTPVTMRPTATAPPLSVEEVDPPADAQTGAAVATLGKRPTIDVERFKFRLVFIFWPALVGISMAL
ncbi:hypothetical protein BV20DRAFT_1098000 [Pilatotrama ljubarskyi]|nr:hypothetical protein BV20DRAFT_1098000 [Pilatotrama ljubarskyi]